VHVVIVKGIGASATIITIAIINLVPKTFFQSTLFFPQFINRQTVRFVFALSKIVLLTSNGAVNCRFAARAS
jgi:hypothetical protein